MPRAGSYQCHSNNGPSILPSKLLTAFHYAAVSMSHPVVSSSHLPNQHTKAFSSSNISESIILTHSPIHHHHRLTSVTPTSHNKNEMIGIYTCSLGYRVGLLLPSHNNCRQPPFSLFLRFLLKSPLMDASSLEISCLHTTRQSSFHGNVIAMFLLAKKFSQFT